MTQVNSLIPTNNIPIEYAFGWLDKSIPAAFAKNDPAYWTQFETNAKSITKESVDGKFSQITLGGGKTYKLIGGVALYANSITDCDRRFRWWNVTESKWIGSEGGFFAYAKTYTNGGVSPAIAYLQIAKDTTIELRCSEFSGKFEHLTPGTYFDIQHLQNLKI